jgi:hypothetical protein
MFKHILTLFPFGLVGKTQKNAMVDLTLKLWQILTLGSWFEKYQAMALYIYKCKLSEINGLSRTFLDSHLPDCPCGHIGNAL